MNFNKNLKVELHVHLDCSLSYDVVKKINPEISKNQYNKDFIGTKCSCLKDYIKCADRAVELMQTRQELELVTIDLFEQLKKDNVIYAEIRFAPLLHLDKGLTSCEVVKIISQITKKQSKKTGIETGLILCTLRHFSENQAMETVGLVNDFKNTNVVGFDIVELCPNEVDKSSDFLAAKLYYKMLSYKFQHETIEDDYDNAYDEKPLNNISKFKEENDY